MTVDKYLRAKQVCEYTGLSRATIYNMEKAGDFPKKIALGERAVAWRESEVKEWMESRKSAQKTGREARPGRPPTSQNKKKKELVPSESPLLKSEGLLQHAPQKNQQEGNTSESAEDDWGQKDSSLTAEQLEKVNVRLNALHAQRPSKARAPKTAVIKRSSKQIVFALPGSERKNTLGGNPRMPVEAMPVLELPKPVDVEPYAVRGITKRKVILAFEGLHFDTDEKWSKALASPPDWLKDCRVEKGNKKTSATWNPALIAAALFDKKIQIKKLDTVFVGLNDWADEWREASVSFRD